MKTKLHFPFSILIIFLIIILSGCPDEIYTPTISTIAVSQITNHTAVSGGNITDGGGASVLGRGLVWSTLNDPTLEANEGFKEEGKGSGVFSSTMYGLTENTQYYVSAYATNEQGTAYGEPIPFITLGSPTVTTIDADPISNRKATLNGVVNANNVPTNVKFEYGTTSSYGSEVLYSQNPVSGTSATNVSEEITGLTSGQTYYFRIVAINYYGETNGNGLTFKTTVKDADGNNYPVVQIGTQVWMEENLKTTKYKDGTAIPLVTDNMAWSNLTTPGYCWYSNNSANKVTYGALYNWYTVNTGNLCPAGWHVPTDAEWTTLENYLIDNGYNYDGTTTGNKIAKSLASTILWTSSSHIGVIGNTDYPAKRNATGFTALPGGNRSYNSTFSGIGYYGYWWSATEYDASSAWGRSLSYDYSYVGRNYGYKKYGFSVRCVRD